jgi:RNA-directed DNA polymerase
MPISTPDGRCDAPRQQSWRTLESRVLRKAHARFGEGRLEKCQQWQLASRLLYFVILSRGRAAEALTWTKAVMTRLGLSINEAKTSLKDARQERFDFLGYSFGPHYYKANGRRYLGASPSKKSVHRLKAKVANLLTPGHTEPWEEVRDRLNRSLRGWSNYFAYGTCRPAFRGMDQYVTERVRAFLARRHKVHGRGNRQFTFDVIHGERGVLALERLPRTASPWALR